MAAVRQDVVAGARRIVVKVGSSSLTTASGGLDADRVDALVDVLATVRGGNGEQAPGETGPKEIVLVSSGAIAAGLAPLGLTGRPKDLARQQAAASVGQGLLVARYTASFARYGIRVGQVLLTTDDTSRRSHYRNAYRTLDQLLGMGAVPVVNENDTVATDEIRFGDNDRLAALVAHLVRADLLVLLSDVDGLYDGNPSTPGTTRIAEVRGPADLAGVSLGSAGKAGVGTGGMVTKVEAARIAAAAGDPGRAHLRQPRRRRARGPRHRHVLPPHGTPLGRPPALAGPRLHPAGRPHPGRRRRTGRRGAPHLAAALPESPLWRGSSAPADPVELRDTAGRAVARGLVNFDAKEIPQLLGRSTRELARELGPAYEREVVHRDDLVILHPGPRP